MLKIQQEGANGTPESAQFPREAAMAFYPRKTNDPLIALKAIVEQNPRAGSEKLLALFEAQVHDDNALQKTVIAQVFAATLLSLSNKTPSG
jgi:hypothetical protein